MSVHDATLNAILSMTSMTAPLCGSQHVPKRIFCLKKKVFFYLTGSAHKSHIRDIVLMGLFFTVTEVENVAFFISNRPESLICLSELLYTTWEIQRQELKQICSSLSNKQF